MAYIVTNDDSSMLSSTAVAFKSFLTSHENPNLMAPPPNSFSFVKRNLMSEIHRVTQNADTTNLPPPSDKESVNVYLRIKPKTPEESEFYSCTDESDMVNIEDENFEVVTIESTHQIALHSPKDSVSFKNSANGAGNVIHRFSFSKIFPPATEQEEVFNEMVLPKLKEFMEGRNQLIFTYGATSSGKTFTIQGNSDRPGILPRALDSIFNTITNQQFEEPPFMPEGFNRVNQIKPDQLEKLREEKKSVFRLGRDLQVAMNCIEKTTASSAHSQMTEDSQDMSQASQASHQSLATMFPHLSNRVRETVVIPISSSSRNLHYSVWVSFAEIYNENCYDLLEKIPEVKRKGEKPRRMPLKLAEDRGGSVYIRGLKEILVSNADEAYQLLMIGRENLQFAATRLNHHSSRSHCIFTIKIIRVVDKDQPHFGRMSMLSFCDLAGSERIKKTMNTGDRQKEAGNINTSLLVLGRCIKTLRHNQLIKDQKRHQIVPFRDSKLTRIFQSFFSGRGKSSMIVNVSQSAYLFDESLQVCKFAAIASKVNIEVIKEPEVEPAKPAAKKERRQSQFSLMVLDKKSKESLLTGRGSIAWEHPQIRSTMCPMPDASSATILEEENDNDDLSDSETTSNNPAEETAVDSRYNGLLAIIDDLKVQLIEEKQKNIKLEAEIRTELCDEFNKMMSESEANWAQRLQDERDRAADLSEWRLNRVQEVYKERETQRKRQRQDSDSEGDSIRVKLLEVETKLKDKEYAIDQLEKQVAAMKTVHSSMTEEQKEHQETISKQSFELANSRTIIGDLESKLSTTKEQLKASNAALEEQSSDPKLKDLGREVAEMTSKMDVLEQEKANMRTLLNEAGVEFLAKKEEITELNKIVKALKIELDEKCVLIQDLENQIEEDRELLTASNTRSDEKDLIISELEETIGKLQAQRDNHENSSKWLERKAVEQQMGNLNDEIENLKADKKKLRALVDDGQAQIKTKDEEITNLEREVKSLLQAENRQREVNAETQAEVVMLRKQIKDLNLKVSDVDVLNKRIKEKEATIENLQLVLDAKKKEENAVEALRIELDRKSQEKSEIELKVQDIQSNLESVNYELSRTKQQKDELMRHYEQTIKKLSDDLVIEKNEQKRIREVMAQNTPKKTKSSEEQEIQSLKEEIKTKTELIKKLTSHEEELVMLRKELQSKSKLIETLSKQIAPTPKKDQEEDEDVLEDLRFQNDRLSKELEEVRSKHTAELNRMKKAYEKVVTEYKETNEELRNGLGLRPEAVPIVVKTEATEEEDNEDVFESSFVGEARKKATGRSSTAVKRKTKMSAHTQVSFEDESIENENPDEDKRSSTNSPTRKTPRRGTRVSGLRPTGNRSRKVAHVSFASDSDIANESGNSSSGRSRKTSSSSVTKPLHERNTDPLSPLAEAFDMGSPPTPAPKTPATGRKKLYIADHEPVEFTPPEFSATKPDAHSILTRSLRSRGSKKN